MDAQDSPKTAQAQWARSILDGEARTNRGRARFAPVVNLARHWVKCLRGRLVNVRVSALEATKLLLEKAKADVARYRSLYEEGLAREVSLVKELSDLHRTLRNTGQQKVVPIQWSTNGERMR